MTLRCFLLMLAWIGFVMPARAAGGHGERVALVIGNSKYPDAETPLKEPINDARDGPKHRQ